MRLTPVNNQIKSSILDLITFLLVPSANDLSLKTVRVKVQHPIWVNIRHCVEYPITEQIRYQVTREPS